MSASTIGTSLTAEHSSDAERAADQWWRTAVVYQVYPRSFADGNGDGIGDIAGLRDRLGYLQQLGVDALWINPWYPSPMADGGYDVIDYRSIHPDFGTLAEAEALITDAHDAGIRIIIDVVPNHCSDANEWFQAALRAEPGSPERERFWFRPGRGAHGELPPNNWQSIFGGCAWTRTTTPAGTPGEWYLHLFAPEQPDFNWNNLDVRQEFEDVLRFWFDRGADGIRIDSAALCVKDPGLPDVATEPGDTPNPFTDLDGVHEVYRAWRRIADTYPGDRVLIGEVWLPDPVRFAMYLRPDELHTCFNFDFMARPWDAAQMRASIDSTLHFNGPLGAPATWVLSNHDVTRPVTRYGREDTSFSFAAKRFGVPADVFVGTRRARGAALLAAALPGSLYIYQGDELGLPEAEEIPLEMLQDPMHFRSGGLDPGRDGCRIPIPWTAQSSSLGFSPDHASADPWLPQPANWSSMAADVQDGDRASMLTLYRGVIQARKELAQLRGDEFNWLELAPGVLAFRRGAAFACVVNMSDADIELPANSLVVLASTALVGDCLPPDAAVWLTLRTV